MGHSKFPKYYTKLVDLKDYSDMEDLIWALAHSGLIEIGDAGLGAKVVNIRWMDAKNLNSPVD